MGGYLLTAYDGITRYCPTCAQRRVIYMQDEAGELLTCCCTCQRILDRRPRAGLTRADALARGGWSTAVGDAADAAQTKTQETERPVQQGEVHWP